MKKPPKYAVARYGNKFEIQADMGRGRGRSVRIVNDLKTAEEIADKLNSLKCLKEYTPGAKTMAKNAQISVEKAQDICDGLNTRSEAQ